MTKLEIAQEIKSTEAKLDELKKMAENAENAENAEKRSIMDKIKSFDDACQSPHLTKEDLWFIPYQDQMPANSLNYEKWKVIAKALNEGHVFTMNPSEKRWYPWFDVSSGFVFFNTNYDDSHADAASASSLCFKTEELVVYFCEQFIEVCKGVIML